MVGKIQPITIQLLCHMTPVFLPFSRSTSRSEITGRSEMLQVDLVSDLEFLPNRNSVFSPIMRQWTCSPDQVTETFNGKPQSQFHFILLERLLLERLWLII